MPASENTSDDERQLLLVQTNSQSSHAGPSHGSHRAHHLKYGEYITTSGFAPQLDEDDEDEIEHLRATYGSDIDIEHHRREMRRDKAVEILDAEARRIHNGRRYLFRKPRAMQYFRGKTLVRSDDERATNRIELFFDLTFVGLIAVLAKEVAEEPTPHVLVRYLITYTMGFLIWTWMRELFNAFYKDDILQRFVVVFVMACLVVYGNNAPKVDQNLDEGLGRIATITSYLVAELAIFANCLFYSFHITAYRLQLRVHILAWLVAAGIWTSTIFVTTMTGIILAVIALTLEYSAWLAIFSPAFKRTFKLRYSSALNIEHELDRFSDFFTLIMGEFVFSVFSGAPAGLGLHASGARAILAVIIAFAFQVFYMLGSSAKKITHPLRRSGAHAITFFVIHLPMVSALTLCGDIMAEFVKKEQVEAPLRWLACETYAIGMVCLWVIAMMERDCDEPGVLWMPRWARLLPRLVAGLVAVPLPLTRHSGVRGSLSPYDVGGHVGIDMTTTKLLAALTALSSFALVWEQIAALDGPNAPYECASEDLLRAAHDKVHLTPEALRTPEWKGYPTCVEPGTFDRNG